jgi:chromosome segregation ATPase
LDTTCKLQEIEELKQKLKERDSFLETIVNQNSKELRQLQSELEELKQKLWEKELALENTVKHTSAEIAANRVARDRDVLRLQTQVGELQQEVWEKKQSAQSVQIQLSEKQLELEKMQSLLDRKEIDMARTNYQAASIEAEVIGLQCQLLALQSQLNAAVETSTYADGNHHTQIAGVQNDQSLLHEENMELARHKYLAAVVAAQEVSGDKEEEPLVLVAELRKNLQAFLRKPSSLLEACGCDMGSPL